MIPKWLRTKIVIEISLLLHPYSCLLLVHVGYRFWRIHPEVLIEISLVLITFLFAFSLVRVQKCEVVNFSRGHLAGVNGLPNM